MAGWTPADVAGYDQEMQASMTQLGRLAAMLREHAGEVGQHQAEADLCLLLMTMSGISVRGLLIAALHQMTAGPDGPGG
jgi:hypothetical protein